MTQLRPALGHPSRTAELDQLCADENARHERAVEHITQHNTDMKVKCVIVEKQHAFCIKFQLQLYMFKING